MFLEHLLLLVKVLSLSPFCKLVLKLPCFYCTHVTQAYEKVLDRFAVAAFIDLIHGLSYQKTPPAESLRNSPAAARIFRQRVVHWRLSVAFAARWDLHPSDVERQRALQEWRSWWMGCSVASPRVGTGTPEKNSRQLKKGDLEFWSVEYMFGGHNFWFRLSSCIVCLVYSGRIRR